MKLVIGRTTVIQATWLLQRDTLELLYTRYSGTGTQPSFRNTRTTLSGQLEDADDDAGHGDQDDNPGGDVPKDDLDRKPPARPSSGSSPTTGTSPPHKYQKTTTLSDSGRVHSVDTSSYKG